MFLLLAAAAGLDPALEDYAATVTGTFSSAAQHARDPGYDEVEARIVRIWPERTDGLWLYQEQAVLTRPDMDRAAARARPYFQFVARVVMLEPGVFRRDNYRIRDGARFAGARVAALTPADLAEPGCHNRIERVAEGVYVGATESCANAWRGAASLRSLSVATRDLYANWDRGFDAEGRRLWGPAAGGYRFARIADD